MAIKVAGTTADNCVDDKKVVASGLPFQVTEVALLNPAPLTVSVKPGPPAVTADGEILVSVSRDVTTNCSEAGWGCPVTLTELVPGFANKAAGTVARSWLEETNCVASPDPFHVTVVPAPKLEGARNPDPFTVSVNAGLPNGAELGDRLVKVSG